MYPSVQMLKLNYFESDFLRTSKDFNFLKIFTEFERQNIF